MAYCCKRKVQKVLIGISVWIESTGDDVSIDDYRIKANHEIIRQYRCTCTVLIYFDWLMEWNIWLKGFWLADGVGYKICDRQTDSFTELEMAVNDWVAFATKNNFLQVAQKPEV